MSGRDATPSFTASLSHSATPSMISTGPQMGEFMQSVQYWTNGNPAAPLDAPRPGSQAGASAVAQKYLGYRSGTQGAPSFDPEAMVLLQQMQMSPTPQVAECTPGYSPYVGQPGGPGPFSALPRASSTPSVLPARAAGGADQNAAGGGSLVPPAPRIGGALDSASPTPGLLKSDLAAPDTGARLPPAVPHAAQRPASQPQLSALGSAGVSTAPTPSPGDAEATAKRWGHLMRRAKRALGSKAPIAVTEAAIMDMFERLVKHVEVERAHSGADSMGSGGSFSSDASRGSQASHGSVLLSVPAAGDSSASRSHDADRDLASAVRESVRISASDLLRGQPGSGSRGAPSAVWAAVEREVARTLQGAVPRAVAEAVAGDLDGIVASAAGAALDGSEPLFTEAERAALSQRGREAAVAAAEEFAARRSAAAPGSAPGAAPDASPQGGSPAEMSEAFREGFARGFDAGIDASERGAREALSRALGRAKGEIADSIEDRVEAAISSQVSGALAAPGSSGGVASSAPVQGTSLSSSLADAVTRGLASSLPDLLADKASKAPQLLSLAREMLTPRAGRGSPRSRGARDAGGSPTSFSGPAGDAPDPRPGRGSFSMRQNVGRPRRAASGDSAGLAYELPGGRPSEAAEAFEFDEALAKSGRRALESALRGLAQALPVYPRDLGEIVTICRSVSKGQKETGRLRPLVQQLLERLEAMHALIGGDYISMLRSCSRGGHGQAEQDEDARWAALRLSPGVATLLEKLPARVDQICRDAEFVLSEHKELARFRAQIAEVAVYDMQSWNARFGERAKRGGARPRPPTVYDIRKLHSAIIEKLHVMVSPGGGSRQSWPSFLAADELRDRAAELNLAVDPTGKMDVVRFCDTILFSVGADRERNIRQASREATRRHPSILIRLHDEEAYEGFAAIVFVVSYFARVFDLQTIDSMIAKISETHVYVETVRNLVAAIKKVTGLPRDASPSRVLEAIQALALGAAGEAGVFTPDEAAEILLELNVEDPEDVLPAIRLLKSEQGEGDA